MLCVQNTGVAMDSKGCVKVDEHLRSSVPHIWALGDVIGRIELTPVALMEGMTFANNCFGEEPRVPDYGSLASAVRPFTSFAQHLVRVRGRGAVLCCCRLLRL